MGLVLNYYVVLMVILLDIIKLVICCLGICLNVG